jgi:hypothetical protein
VVGNAGTCSKPQIRKHSPKTCRYRSAYPNLDYFRLADKPGATLFLDLARLSGLMFRGGSNPCSMSALPCCHHLALHSSHRLTREPSTVIRLVVRQLARRAFQRELG